MMNILSKKIIAGAFATTLILSAGIAVAQGDGDKRQGQGPRLDYIYSQLELTEAEQVSVEEVLQAFAEENRQKMWDQRKAMQDLEDRPSQEDMAAQREANKAEALTLLTDRLNTVLSPNLTEELVEYLDAHHGMGNERGGKNRKPGSNERGERNSELGDETQDNQEGV